ncbi:MAG: hypothetical protein J7L19_05750 [Dehalococcoidia bacterium]|nr:hypothetical protein [Dehalococcoidia bacterium]
MNLCQIIIDAAKVKGIKPFKQPFKPTELGIKASDYGSFSDWCAAGTTKSAKYNPRVCLTVTKSLMANLIAMYLCHENSGANCFYLQRNELIIKLTCFSPKRGNIMAKCLSGSVYYESLGAWWIRNDTCAT